MAKAAIQAQQSIRGFGSSKCPYHFGQEVIYACEDCRELACVKCATSRHRGHVLDDLGEIIPEVNRNLQDCVSRLEQIDIPQINESLKAANDDLLKEKQFFKNEIEEKEEERCSLKKQLENVEKSLKALRDGELINISRLQNREQEVRSQLDERKSQLDEVKEALRSGSNVLKYDVANILPPSTTEARKDPLTNEAEGLSRSTSEADSTMHLPGHWAMMAHRDNVSVVPLKPTDQEFVTVQHNFLKTVGNPRKVINIERIQNRMLYQQYVAKKKLFDTQNPAGTQNERSLWHGIAPNAIDSINTCGFNRSYCGKDAVVFGNGVYFAVNSQYSAQKRYSVPDASGYQRMYQCKVLTGEFTKGAGGMRVPPQKQQGVSHILFDSVVDNPKQPFLFVIFNDTQAYPEYLITYQ